MDDKMLSYLKQVKNEEEIKIGDVLKNPKINNKHVTVKSLYVKKEFDCIGGINELNNC